MIYVREKPDPNYDSLRHDKCDIVTKDTIKTFPEYILQSVLAITDFTFLEFVDGEFITVDVRRADSLIKVRLNDEIVWFILSFR